jgi:hypothetical protein
MCLRHKSDPEHLDIVLNDVARYWRSDIRQCHRAVGGTLVLRFAFYDVLFILLVLLGNTLKMLYTNASSTVLPL